MVNNVYVSAVTKDNISRTELLAWVNDCLLSNFSKIEEMSTGAGYCQMTDFLFPGSIQLKKVKWNSRNEVDHINNWKYLQTAWKELGIDKPVRVESLLKAKFQDNFEFLQWFKKFFDANYDGHEYDPVAARGGEALPAGAKGPGSRAPAARVASRPVASNAPAKKPTAVAAPTTRAPPTRTVAPIGRAVPVVNNNGAEQKLIEDQRLQIEDLENKFVQFEETVVGLEKERMFYWDKLRKVEDLCTAVPEGEKIDVAPILAILYAADEDDGANDQQNDICDEHIEDNKLGDVTLEMAGAQIDDDETF